MARNGRARTELDLTPSGATQQRRHVRDRAEPDASLLVPRGLCQAFRLSGVEVRRVVGGACARRELDGLTHEYTADEWRPVVYDIAAPLLESARLNREPPSLVQHTQEAVHWLASAVISLDQDSAETPAALADALGRLLTVCVFADAARHRGG